MPELTDEIAAFDAMRADLEHRAAGRWVVVHGRQLINTYESFDEAAEDAVRQFGRGPYLIRQIGAKPVVLPASVVYHLAG